MDIYTHTHSKDLFSIKQKLKKKNPNRLVEDKLIFIEKDLIEED